MNIVVIGMGYVGFVIGICFVEIGNYVICVDIDEKKVECLKQGEILIYEFGFDIFFDCNIR